MRLNADAEEAKQTGGMIALYPRSDFAQMLAVPGGEPESDLHVTLVFLGDDVDMFDPASLGSIVGRTADSYPEITARIFGHAIFNPDGHEGRDPCGVYLVGHSPELAQIHDDLRRDVEGSFPIPEQHDPWIPHITAGYDSQAAVESDSGLQVGEYTGEVIFDRLGVALAGQTQFYPFISSTPHALTAYYSPHWPL